MVERYPESILFPRPISYISTIDSYERKDDRLDFPRNQPIRNVRYPRTSVALYRWAEQAEGAHFFQYGTVETYNTYQESHSRMV